MQSVLDYLEEMAAAAGFRFQYDFVELPEDEKSVNP